MAKDKELVHFPAPKVTKDHIIFYGAGKFQEEKLIWDRTQAALAMIELYKFLEKK